MIELQGVSKRFGAHAAVDGVDLACRRGETHVLIGPSGCGKSTLLRMIVGLVTPDAGSVVVGGEPLGPGNLTAVRRRIGYMIQEGGLFPHLTAPDNAAIMPRFLGWQPRQTAGAARPVVRADAADPDVARPPSAAALRGATAARQPHVGLMLDPDILLLDEPLGDLDPMIRADLQQDLHSIFLELDKTVVLVTHDLAEAGFLGDRITLLRSGRIVQQGAFEELVEQPADDFVAKFVRAQRQVIS